MFRSRISASSTPVSVQCGLCARCTRFHGNRTLYEHRLRQNIYVFGWCVLNIPDRKPKTIFKNSLSNQGFENNKDTFLWRIGDWLLLHVIHNIHLLCAQASVVELLKKKSKMASKLDLHSNRYWFRSAIFVPIVFLSPVISNTAHWESSKRAHFVAQGDPKINSKIGYVEFVIFSCFRWSNSRSLIILFCEWKTSCPTSWFRNLTMNKPFLLAIVGYYWRQ